MIDDKVIKTQTEVFEQLKKKERVFIDGVNINRLVKEIDEIIGIFISKIDFDIKKFENYIFMKKDFEKLKNSSLPGNTIIDMRYCVTIDFKRFVEDFDHAVEELRLKMKKIKNTKEETKRIIREKVTEFFNDSIEREKAIEIFSNYFTKIQNLDLNEINIYGENGSVILEYKPMKIRMRHKCC